MKKLLMMSAALLAVLCMLCGCSDKNTLDPDNPVVLSMWHIYGEQAESPMNVLIDEFNRTEGREKGVIVDVTSMSDASSIGDELLRAQKEEPGALPMPDLFFGHTNNANSLGAENLVDWKQYFTEEELSGFVDNFISEGTIKDRLVVLPVSKSTHLIFVNGTQFEKLCKEEKIDESLLESWEGFYKVAEKYYEWSGGKAFCAFDYPVQSVELAARSRGGFTFTDEGWLNFEDDTLHKEWIQFAEALVKGHVVVSDLYSNTQVMTGEVIAGISSSAAILYYNDTVTYDDNSSEPINLKVYPIPQYEFCAPLANQAGAGLCAFSSTEEKAIAAYIFAKWFTQEDRNLEFAAQTGYMPVTKGAFDAISEYDFKDEGYRNLYEAFNYTKEHCRFVTEPGSSDFFPHVIRVYDVLREEQSRYHARYLAGEDSIKLAERTWKKIKGIK